jgi:protein pelota
LFHRWLEGQRGLLLVPEEPYDLWVIRRIISRGDEVEAWSTREVKQEGDYIRPDKGRRVKVKVRIKVESVSFDNELGRLRLRGSIIQSNNEMVRRGAFHSIEIAPSTEFSLWKDSFPERIRKIVEGGQITVPVVIVAMDSREAGVGTLLGLSLRYAGTVRSGLSGKMYKQDSSKLMEQYISNVAELVKTSARRSPGATVILLGPGQSKARLANKISGEKSVRILEGFDLAGEDGVRLALSDQRFRDAMSGSHYEAVASFLEEAKLRLAKNDGRLAVGYAQCRAAVDAGAVDVIMLSDELFRAVDEEKVIDLASRADEQAAKVYMLDGSTILGVQVSRMGGAVALLRYQVPFQ